MIALDGPLPVPPGVLTGPADADHFRVKVGRYGDRWYHDPLDADDTWDATDDTWPSISICKKASGADWTYVALKRVNEHFADIAKLRAFKDANHAGRYDILKSANSRGLDQATRRGTNVHRIAEALLYGLKDNVGPDDPGAEYRGAVNAFFDAYQPELVAAEFVCVHRSLNGAGYGGTADALLRIGGELAVIDWKSRGADSEHGGYPEEGAQIAAYACADYMIVEGDNGPVRRPVPRTDVGYIVSIKPDGYRVHPVDIAKAFDHWTALHAWWVARRDERAAIGKPLAPRKARTPKDEQDAIRADGPPDEGDDVDDQTFAVLERTYKAIDDKAWINAVASQAQKAGVSFHTKGHHTVRRYEIMRGLILLWKVGYADDDMLRAALHIVVGDVAHFASLTPGQVLGSLGATDAAEFARVCARMATSSVSLVFTDEGHPTLRFAA